MAGLVPSSRLGKPGRKGLFPSRGCGGNPCPVGQTSQEFIDYMTSIAPGDISITLPAMTGTDCKCVDLSGTYILQRVSAWHWRIQVTGCLTTIASINLFASCAATKVRFTAALISNHFPTQQGNYWLSDYATYSTTGVIKPIYEAGMPHGNFIPCDTTLYGDATYTIL